MRIWTTLLLMTGGCTWISQADIDARQDDLDDDGDGFLAAEDCDDADAAINPGVEETWYDGIDSNCSGDDDFDADADGFVPDGYFGQATAGVEGSGTLTAGDCDDTDATINPGATDSWYDGIDQDCDSENDYDADYDGYATDEYATDAGLPGGDCDDDDATYNPGITETWYDGIDSNCSGDDDFDADADGFVPDYFDTEDFTYTKTEGLPDSGRLTIGDCDDTDATYNPDATEVWYDGEDLDCAGDNDYDADADGYTPTGYAVKAKLPDGDCDDEDAGVNPAAMEVLGDSRDLDCDGAGDSVYALDIPDMSWVSPRAPQFAQNAQGIYLSILGEEINNDGTLRYDAGIALQFDADDPLGGVKKSYFWQGYNGDPSNYSITDGHGFILNADRFFGMVGLQFFGAERYMQMTVFEINTESSDNIIYSLSSTLSPTTFTDLSLVQDSKGTLYGIGCDASSGYLQYFATSLTSANAGSFDVTDYLEDYTADACALHLYDAPTATLVSSQAGLVTESFDTTADELELTEENLNSAYSALAIEIPAGNPDGDALVVVADPDAIYVFEGDTIHRSYTTSNAPVSLQASYDDTGDMIIAFADDAGDAWLLVGDPTIEDFAAYSITTDFSATDAAAWVYDGVVTIAVAGSAEVALGAAEL